ncbi:MAG TPA: hypothetical protein VE987_15650 [Polyangiaceae bacterium]|nr:hypothetical protein [Polyangiaceae bacterium]
MTAETPKQSREDWHELVKSALPGDPAPALHETDAAVHWLCTRHGLGEHEARKVIADAMARAEP